MGKTKILPIHRSLRNMQPFELAKTGVIYFVNNLEANKQLSKIDKFKLARLFSDRLLDDPEYNQTS